MQAVEVMNATSNGREKPPAVQRTVDAVTALLSPVLADVGVFLDRVELVAGPKRAQLRIFIDSAAGVTVDDCAEVSRRLSSLLELEDVIRRAYVLEVSSPGLMRRLHNEEDFRRYTGRLARVHARKPIVGRKREAVGRLQGVEAGAVLLEERKSGEVVHIALDDVVKAHLEIDMEVVEPQGHEPQGQAG